MTTVSDVAKAVDRLAPFRLAEAWDNVGILLGDKAWPVHRVLVALDVSETVVAEAARRRADLIFSHHPFFFKDVDRLTADTRPGRLALALAKARCAVIAAHTNLDAAEEGIGDILSRMAGLVDLMPLRPGLSGKHYKVVIFVPVDHLETVRAAAFAAGAGRIGRYEECSFSVEGAGTFRPGAGARPAVGSRGRRNTVRESRLEFLADPGVLGAVLAAVTRAHPYEEPAIDVFSLHALAAGEGLGRIGRPIQPITAGRFADKVKRSLGLRQILLAGKAGRKVTRVAVCTGSGSGLVESVLASGCDAYLAGELKFHEIEDLAAAGVTVILGGHYATERVPLNAWTPRLARALKGVDVRLSRAELAAERWV